MAKITIIVPVYGVEKYLQRCVDSIIRQRYLDIQIILIDDGSSDRSSVLCDEYLLREDRIIVIHKKNGGLSDARNYGINLMCAVSESEYVTFIDSDDWVHDDYLGRLVDALDKTGLSVAAACFERTTGQASVSPMEKSEPIVIDVQDFYCHYNITSTTAWGKLFRSSDWQILRFPKGKIHEDEYTTWKILFRYKRIAFVKEPLYAYFCNSEGIMGSAWSTKRLDIIPAYEEKIRFFSRNGRYAEALKSTQNLYFPTLLTSINNLSKVEPSDTIRRIIGKIRRKALLYLLREENMSFKEKVGNIEQISPIIYKILIKFI